MYDCEIVRLCNCAIVKLCDCAIMQLCNCEIMHGRQVESSGGVGCSSRVGGGKAETEAIAQHCWSTRPSEASDRGFLERVKPPPRGTCSQLQVLQAFSWEGCKEEEEGERKGESWTGWRPVASWGRVETCAQVSAFSLSQQGVHLDF